MQTKEYYIGKIYAEDVYAYANMRKKIVENEDGIPEEHETGFVRKISDFKGGYMAFSWSAALTESLWYVYRGMVKEAIAFDIIGMVLGGILLRFSIISFMILFFLLSLFRGFLAVPLYYERMEEAVKLRGLLRRAPSKNEMIRESLQKEGKPSVVRTVVYFMIKCFFAVCLDSILYSLFCFCDLI